MAQRAANTFMVPVSNSLATSSANRLPRTHASTLRSSTYIASVQVYSAMYIVSSAASRRRDCATPVVISSSLTRILASIVRCIVGSLGHEGFREFFSRDVALAQHLINGG